MNSTPRITMMRRPRRSGFSLVELLLSIFILAIGVIAISAIFPAGIIQPQQATDDVIGPIVAQNALGVLRSKLDQEDFGTFEQFGIYLKDNLPDGEDVQSVAVESPSPGDWTWMRPSYVLRGGVADPEPSANLTPNPLHGAMDVFGLRHTRKLMNFSDLPEQAGEPAISPSGAFNSSGFYTTSDLSRTAINGNPADTGQIPMASPDFFQGVYEGAEDLCGIPYNRNKHAVLNPFSPTDNFNGPYISDPARQGRDEPMVTILQSERVWPQGSARPQYVWDCMFRRYQGRIQVAIFVYRVSAASNEPRAWSVPFGKNTSFPPNGLAQVGWYESPMPARALLPDDGYWTARGLDSDNETNRLDDLIVPNTAPSGSVLSLVDPYSEGWQSPNQWLLDQNGNIHRVLAGRRNQSEGPVRLARPVPHVARHASNGNVDDGFGNSTTVDQASAVKAVWFIPPETVDGMILTPVFVTVRDL